MKHLCIVTSLSMLLPGISISTVAADDDVSTESISQRVKVTVNSSTVQNGEDAEPRTSVSGRIVIVGPDGKRQEYDLSDKLPDGLKGVVGGLIIPGGEVDSDEPRFMIGVNCEPVGELLRSHLKLGERGLVVNRVSTDMPASEAGVEKGDILLKVGDKDLKTLDDLVSAVLESKGEALTIQRIHRGDVSEVVVTAKMATNRDAVSDLLKDLESGDLSEMFRGMKLSQAHQDAIRNLNRSKRELNIQSFGPAIELFDAAEFEGSFAELIGKARRLAIERAAKAGHDDDASQNRNAEADARTIDELKKEIATLREGLVELRERLRAKESPN